MKFRPLIFSLIIVITIAMGVTLILQTKSVIEASRQPSEPSATAEMQRQIERCLGRAAGEIIQELKLTDLNYYWEDEPPGKLRGVTFSFKNGGYITLRLAPEASLFRRFNENRQWNFDEFLGCKIGAISYSNGIDRTETFEHDSKE